MVEAGKQRSPGIVILLFVVTLGIYWFVWQWKAFGELERKQSADLKKTSFLVPMIILWVLALGIGGSVYMDTMAEQKANPTAAQNPLEIKFKPMHFVQMGVMAAFYAIQAIFQFRATKLVASAVPPGTNPPNPILAIVFNVLMIFANVPIAGMLAAIGGIVVAIVWVVQTQGALNKIWTNAAPALPPMQFGAAPAMR